MGQFGKAYLERPIQQFDGEILDNTLGKRGFVFPDKLFGLIYGFRPRGELVA